MDSGSSNRRLLLAILAGAGLVVVMCVALVAIVWVANGGSGRLSGQRAVQSLDRIAFVGPDDSLYVTDRNGQDVELLVAVEEGTSLGYPTWSPDGRRVAYLAQRQTGSGVESGLYAVSTQGDAPTRLYTSANHPPFYLYWSPDSQYISFLTQEDAGLALRLASADGSGDARVLERGAPFYWSWSPEGKELFMHIGGARHFSGDAHMAILSSQPNASPAMLDDAPASFQAPAWSPDGERILYAGEDESGGQALYLRGRAGGAVEKLVDVSGSVGFNWSPDGRWIAYQQIAPGNAPLGDVFLMPAPGATLPGGRTGSDESGADGGVQVRQVSRDLTVAFFWSPDSTRLALLVPSLEDSPATHGGSLSAPLPQEPQLVLHWWVAEVPDGELHPVAAFRPSSAFLQILPFFDQYAHSIRFWSPDSRYLVYGDQESPTQAGIWVADVLAQEPARRLADGSMPIWSWQ
jgi:TolB protein